MQQQAYQPIWQLSQGQLNLLTSCPRKFQHRYLDQIDPSLGLETQSHQRLGTQFHQLMQQQALGLEIQPLIAAHPPIQTWFDSFAQFPPPMIRGEHLSEYHRWGWLEGYLLVAIYDLLILNPEQAQVLDWKSYARPRQDIELRQNWQTRLYLYLLAETSDYAPEQISMTYWFAEAPELGRANTLTFAYDQTLHAQTHQELRGWLSQLRDWCQAYARGEDFPQVPLTAQQCYTAWGCCPFVNRCQREQQQTTKLARQVAWADIEAIAELALDPEVNPMGEAQEPLL
ncbi:MAG: PD-(D/E)XK nuclease family protein [Acaryochloridaceae cyanobacterium SU_2_1]|nr:PD-(D/E)XK nuclease family protein [Acaryochloridaceae cyanobacterium SU_2_1]